MTEIGSERTQKLGDVVRAAAEHAVPLPSDTPLDAKHPDTVRFVLERWHATRKGWDARELAADQTWCRQDASVYAHAPQDAEHHRQVARAEMRALLDRARPRKPPVTWPEWTALAVNEKSRLYPCLVLYTGHEPHAEEYVRQLLLNSSAPVLDPRADWLYQNAQKAFAMMVANVDLFHRVGTYRRAIRLHKAWPAYSREHFGLSSEAFNAAYASLSQLTLTPCTRLLSERAMPPGASRAPATSALRVRDLLVALLASRLIKELVFDQLLGQLKTHVASLPFQPSYADSLGEHANELRLQLAASGYLFSGANSDDDDSIYTLARNYASRSNEDEEAQGAFLDPHQLWVDVRARLSEATAHWFKTVVTPIRKDVMLFWSDCVPHAQHQAEAHQAVAISAQLRADLTQTTRDSYTKMPATPAQLQWRLQSTWWWHKTAGRARVCGCARSQLAYVACMLRHLFVLGLSEDP